MRKYQFGTTLLLLKSTCQRNKMTILPSVMYEFEYDSMLCTVVSGCRGPKQKPWVLEVPLVFT
jgi:hypothetical protein